ncbi:MAG: helix-turn-helix domain-containing protein [Candidatus Limnocylindrales bacterium]
MGPGSPFACALGQEVRALRLARGLSQAEVGAPLTRAFVSSVEAGRVLPSLPALLLISARLGVGPGELLGRMDMPVNRWYTPAHGREPAQPRRGRPAPGDPHRQAHPS